MKRAVVIAALSLCAANQGGDRYADLADALDRSRSVTARFVQQFHERESGMELTERGEILGIKGLGLVVAYEDGRAWVMTREGITEIDDGRRGRLQPWRDGLDENPLLWLVGLVDNPPRPEHVEDDTVRFGPRKNLWRSVEMSFAGMGVFPVSLTTEETGGSINRFRFNDVRWNAPKDHPLRRYLE